MEARLFILLQFAIVVIMLVALAHFDLVKLP